MFSIKEINDYLNDIKGTDTLIMQADKELAKLENKLLGNPLVVDYIANTLRTGIDKELNRIESEENKMNTRDILINKLIEKDAIQLRRKLIDQIDIELQLIHKVLIGETSLFDMQFIEIAEAQNEFNALVNLRKTFHVDIPEFLKIDIADAIQHTSLYITPNIKYILNEIIKNI